jgi:hypothetical protein
MFGNKPDALGDLHLGGTSNIVVGMGGAKSLRKARIPRTEFDPANPEHRESLRQFMETNNWGTIQFFAEEPYTTVPDTVMNRFIKYALDQLDHKA